MQMSPDSWDRNKNNRGTNANQSQLNFQDLCSWLILTLCYETVCCISWEDAYNNNRSIVMTGRDYTIVTIISLHEQHG